TAASPVPRVRDRTPPRPRRARLQPGALRGLHGRPARAGGRHDGRTRSLLPRARPHAAARAAGNRRADRRRRARHGVGLRGALRRPSHRRGGARAVDAGADPMTAPAARPARLVEPFDLGDVELGEGSVFLRARDGMLHLARVYPVDRLLAVFRANAGLDTRGARPPGGWEEFGHPNEEAWGEHDYPGADRAQTANLLRGHYAGHFLSMLALAAEGERDEALRRKVGELVDGLAEVQSALAATGRFSHPGFLAAYGEWQFARLEELAPYGEIWAPYYTCHKIMAGLLDAYELAGNERALEVATAMGRWVAHRLGRLDRAHLQRMWSLYIAGEYGGMNETLARLSVVADAPELLDTARLFEQDELLAAGSSGDDVLTGMHANQHLPQLVGYV